MAVKPIHYNAVSEEYSWLKDDTKPTEAAEGAIGYEVDATQTADAQVSIYKYLQGDWRQL